MSPPKPTLDDLRIERRPESAAGPRLWPLAGGVIVLVLAVLAIWWMMRPKAVAVHTVVAREVATSASGDRMVLNASGYVTARRQATVSSKVTGKVIEVLIEEGMKVEKDQILARLDPSQAQQALALSEAQLQMARRAIVEDEARLREATVRKNRMKDLLAAGV